MHFNNRSIYMSYDELYKEWRQRSWFLYERLQIVFAVLRKPRVIGRRYNRHNLTHDRAWPAPGVGERHKGIWILGINRVQLVVPTVNSVSTSGP